MSSSEFESHASVDHEDPVADDPRLAQFQNHVARAFETNALTQDDVIHPDSEVSQAWLAHQRTFATSDQTCRRYFHPPQSSDEHQSLVAIQRTCAWRQRFFGRAQFFDLFLTGKVDTVDEPRSPERSPAFSKLARELATGKMYVAPYVDARGRTVVIMRPGVENSTNVAHQVETIVYTLERALAQARSRQDVHHHCCPLTILLDFSNFSIRKAPSIQAARLTIDIVQQHYLSAIATALILHPPWVFHTFYKLIQPLLNAEAREKITFVTEKLHPLADYFDLDELGQEFGGRNTSYCFDPVTYLASTPSFR